MVAPVLVLNLSFFGLWNKNEEAQISWLGVLCDR